MEKEEINEKILNFNFVLIGGDGKQPIEKGWQNKIHRIDDSIFLKHIKTGKNYGVQPNNSQVIINDKSYFLIIVDFDKKEFQDKIINQFPQTFTTTSGSSKNCFHLWFASDNNKSFKIKNEKLETLADIIGAGNQVIGIGSKHNSGSIYSVVKDVPIVFMPYTEIEAILKPHDKSPKKIEKPKKQYIPKGMNQDISSQIIGGISMENVLQEIGIDTSKNPTNCFAHSSVGGKCLGWDDETAHCFHCDNSWNKYSLIREAKNLTDKETFEWFAEKSGLSDELKKSRKEYKEQENPTRILTDKSYQVEKFGEIQPIFYDKAGCWWLWNKSEYKWELVDEIDILNMMQDGGHQTIPSKERTEIINALKQYGRRKIPRPVEINWIQFKDLIFDLKTGLSFPATPEYFITNPIPYKLSASTETPNMDRIFGEWVGKDNIQILYEILAYCLLMDYPINRLFCFIGAGMNGKSCFLRLLQKFIGIRNVCTTELDTLLNSRFEITKLHKKLVCIMGETNFNEISKTSVLKKLTGGDLIGFEYKNKLPFDEKNYAKIIIATNNLPTTNDKTSGFYRRWLIIDFPNTFTEQKEILSEIPEEEYNNLASKCLLILQELLSRRTFTNEGTVEERMERFEARSDFLQKFINMFTEQDVNGFIIKQDFIKKFAGWCKERGYRQLSDTTLGVDMKKKGFETSKKSFDWINDGKGGQLLIWYGLKWKK